MFGSAPRLGGPRRLESEDGTHVGGDGGVRVRAAGGSVEVELEGDELRVDVLALLLEKRGREARGLEPVDRVDQLRLPAGEDTDKAGLLADIATGGKDGAE